MKRLRSKIPASKFKHSLQDGNVGLVKRLWPQCNVVLTCDTGAFSLAADLMRNTFTKDIPIYSPIYAASEGLLGINIWPENKPSRYLLSPQSMFFEFIPVEQSDEQQPHTLFMDQVNTFDLFSIVLLLSLVSYTNAFTVEPHLSRHLCYHV